VDVVEVGLGVTTIRRATVADAARLSRFAAECFRDTYAAMNTPQDMDRYVAEKFTEAQQSAEISDATGGVWLAEVTDEPDASVRPHAGGPALAGYAQLVRGAVPASVRGPAIEVSRFYVARRYHGRGIAGALFAAVLAHAEALGVATIWLGVWERNPRAIAFYQKQGFVEVGAQDFLLGTDVQHDLVLARPLTPRSSM
jgi:ribosomal protein S18 acetylase RimI-like enzyme